jgi:hypothetical protein
MASGAAATSVNGIGKIFDTGKKTILIENP